MRGMSFLLILIGAAAFTVCLAIGSGTNTAAMLAVCALFVLAPLLYWAPAIVAGKAGHRNTMAIAVLNTLLGWTVIGWVVALVWAYVTPPPSAARPST